MANNICFNKKIKLELESTNWSSPIAENTMKRTTLKITVNKWQPVTKRALDPMFIEDGCESHSLNRIKKKSRLQHTGQHQRFKRQRKWTDAGGTGRKEDEGDSVWCLCGEVDARNWKI